MHLFMISRSTPHDCVSDTAIYVVSRDWFCMRASHTRCRWTQYQAFWSSKADLRIGTVAHLQTLLEEVVEEEWSRSRFTVGTDRRLLMEAAPPHHQSHNIG
mmetsp:Transcript_35273/g.70325  ORF Transcript_35273/g.70325 Transcript_35273/m.70325 type:complete len:101 (+) Transcript_35273:4708-5010(+)